MTDEEKAAFVDFIKSGHGFVGSHTGTDTFYTWQTYNDIVGGYFNGHPWHQLVTIDVVDPSSKIVGFLAPSFQINDEDLYGERFPRGHIAHPPSPRSQVGGPQGAWRAAPAVRLSGRLDAHVWKGPGLLQQFRAWRRGLERSAFPGDAPQRHQVDDAANQLVLHLASRAVEHGAWSVVT